MAVQWLGLHASTAGGTGSIPGQGTKIPHALWHDQKQNRKGKKANKISENKSAQGDTKPNCEVRKFFFNNY